MNGYREIGRKLRYKNEMRGTSLSLSFSSSTLLFFLCSLFFIKLLVTGQNVKIAGS